MRFTQLPQLKETKHLRTPQSLFARNVAPCVVLEMHIPACNRKNMVLEMSPAAPFLPTTEKTLEFAKKRVFTQQKKQVSEQSPERILIDCMLPPCTRVSKINENCRNL